MDHEIHVRQPEGARIVIRSPETGDLRLGVIQADGTLVALVALGMPEAVELCIRLLGEVQRKRAEKGSPTPMCDEYDRLTKPKGSP